MKTRKELQNITILDLSKPAKENYFLSSKGPTRVLNEAAPTPEISDLFIIKGTELIDLLLEKSNQNFKFDSAWSEQFTEKISVSKTDAKKTPKENLVYSCVTMNENGDFKLADWLKKFFPKKSHHLILDIIKLQVEASYDAVLTPNGEFKKDIIEYLKKPPYEEDSLKNFIGALGLPFARKAIVYSAGLYLADRYMDKQREIFADENKTKQAISDIDMATKGVEEDQRRLNAGPFALGAIITNALAAFLPTYIEKRIEKRAQELLNQYEKEVQKQKKIIATEEAKGETTEQAKKNLRLVQARITLEKLKETYEPFRLNKFVEMSELNEVLSNGLKVAALQTDCVNYKIHLEKQYKNENIGGETPTSKKGGVVDELMENLKFKSASATQQLDNFSQAFVAKFIPLMKDLDRKDKKFLQALRQQLPAIDTILSNKEKLAHLQKEYNDLAQEQRKIVVEELRPAALTWTYEKIQKKTGTLGDALKDLKDGKDLSDWTPWKFTNLKESIDEYHHILKEDVRLNTALEINKTLDDHRRHLDPKISDAEKIQLLSDCLAVAKLQKECGIYKFHLEELNSSLNYNNPLAEKTRGKLKEVNNLIELLAADKTNKEKIDSFKTAFNKSASILAFNPDKPSIQFLKTVKRILTAIVTLGYYPYAKAKQTGSFKFWKSPEQIHFEKMQRVVSPDAPSGKSKGPKSQSQ